MNQGGRPNDNNYNKCLTAVSIIMTVMFICMGERNELNAQKGPPGRTRPN